VIVDLYAISALCYVFLERYVSFICNLIRDGGEFPLLGRYQRPFALKEKCSIARFNSIRY